MGTKVQNLPGHYSMRDLNEESSSCGWPLLYGDTLLSTNGQYYNNHLPSATTDLCSVYDKDYVKRTMLEHEAIFKNQVYELHRLYRIQKDLMNEVKRNELYKGQIIPVEASYSTGPLASQITTENGQKWHISGFPVGNSTCAKTSVSGVGGMHSPLSSGKGTNKQTDLFPLPNGCSSKGVEVLESRPSKVRRKTFDLHLPADAYIDVTDETVKISAPTLSLPDRSCNNGKEGDEKLFCGNGGKTVCLVETSRSEQSFRSNGLADLNEPFEVEERNDSSYFPLLSHNSFQAATEGSDLSATKQKSRFFGLSGENSLNSHHGTDSLAQNNGYLESSGSRKGWISSAAEAGQAKCNQQFIPHILKQEMQDAHSKALESASDYLNGRSRADSWRERTVGAMDIGERNRDHSVNKHPGHFGVGPSSDLSKSWSHRGSSWELPNGSVNALGTLSRSFLSRQSNGVLESSCCPLNVNLKSNPGFQCDVPVRNGFYPGSSSCGSKEPSTNLSSISYDYLNHNNDCAVIHEHLSNFSSTYKVSNSNCNGVKSGKGIDLNVLLSNGSSNDLICHSGTGTEYGEQKHEEHHAALPWLRGKTSCKNEAQNSNRCITVGESRITHVDAKLNKDETGKGPGRTFIHNVTSVSCSNDIEPRRAEASESSSSKKNLSVPIFGMFDISPKKELSSINSPSGWIPNVCSMENNRKSLLLDINLPCDDDALELEKVVVAETIVSKERSPTTEASSRTLIDLNLSMSDDEASLTSIPSPNKKMKVEIDLESPAVLKTEEAAIMPEEKQLETSIASILGLQDPVELPQDERMRNAAEAIVVMSSLPCNQVDDVVISSESPVVDPLSWFVDMIIPGKDYFERKSDTSLERNGEDNAVRMSKELDYFESMTLNLADTKEEDYLPKPFVPEDFKMEEATSSLPPRTRKGPARRGRQRRDFQRDILPGLASLSRHEVTEDLQIFGGLMRATGHPWNSGLTRRSSSRNGCGRGRRRGQVVTLQAVPSPPQPAAANEPCAPLLIQQLNSIEGGLEDRSLTGWGKTTRRPRRQRGPAGNHPSIPLT